MTDLIEHFTTEELRTEIAKRTRIELLQARVASIQEMLDGLIYDATQLNQTITLINKRVETLIIKESGRDINE